MGQTTAVGDALVHRASGLRFQVNSAATIPALGYIDVDILAVDVGAATRLAAGEVLEYLAPPPGIQTKLELQLDLDEDGFDAEQESSLSRRFLAKLAEPAAGGNDADFVAWSLEVAGIASVFVYPGRAGLGTVDIAALHNGTGTARALNPTERATLLAYLVSKAPAALAGGALRVLDTIAEPQVVELLITPNGESVYEFDWDDTSPPLVLTWTAGTKTLQFQSPRPASMKAGDRIVLAGVASAQEGEVLTIEALTATDSVILRDAPIIAPAANDIVYAAGPLTDLVRTAIKAHLSGEIIYASADRPLPASVAASTVNLQILTDGVGTANPAGAYGTWVGGVSPSILSMIASYTRGVRRATVAAPATEVDATDYTFPLDSQIGFVIPSSILVRKG